MKEFKIISKTYGEITTLLDDEDYEKVLNMGKWCVSRDRYGYYFQKRINKKIITLHRFIMNAPKGIYIDHIDHNTLNNQKSNLRICSNADNIRNGKLRVNNKSGYTGVRYRKDRKKWYAYIKVNYKNITLGTYKTKEEAINARKEAEIKYFKT